MKQVTAYIQPQSLEPVLEALDEIPVRGLSVSEVRGFGRGRAELIRQSPSYQVRQFSKKLRLEIVCHPAQADLIARTIERAARTGQPGDGKIFISSVEKAISIVTGEENEGAI